MERQPGNIKVIVAAGVSVPDAIKAALPCTSAEFAERYGFNPAHVSSCIHGRQRLDRIRVALAETLDVDLAWLDEQLDAVRNVAA
jgi:hypothetical protein